MSLGCAKTAAVFSVIFAGINLYQMTAGYHGVREKAAAFSEIAREVGAASRIIFMRMLLYVIAPLIYLWTMLCAGLPLAFLIVAGVKFWISSFLGIWTERRLIAGMEYAPADHIRARADASANIVLAASAIWLILTLWR
jgi:hypothetical protein